jgi:hypothetical protein
MGLSIFIVVISIGVIIITSFAVREKKTKEANTPSV